MAHINGVLVALNALRDSRLQLTDPHGRKRGDVDIIMTPDQMQ